MFACCFRLIFRWFINILTTNLCNICKKQSSTHCLLQGEHLQGADRFVGSFHGGVHQEQNYLSRPTKINAVTLVLHVNCFLGYR